MSKYSLTMEEKQKADLLQSHIECFFCGAKLQILNSHHLASHGISIEDYRILLPDYPTSSPRYDYIRDLCNQKMRDDNQLFSEQGHRHKENLELGRKVGRTWTPEQRRRQSERLKAAWGAVASSESG